MFAVVTVTARCPPGRAQRRGAGSETSPSRAPAPIMINLKSRQVRLVIRVLRLRDTEERWRYVLRRECSDGRDRPYAGKEAREQAGAERGRSS